MDKHPKLQVFDTALQRLSRATIRAANETFGTMLAKCRQCGFQHTSAPWYETNTMPPAPRVTDFELQRYLAEARALALTEIRAFVPSDPVTPHLLYDLVLDYPLREAKGLRPALCIAACRARGGQLQSVTRSAAVLELYHNAFLVHDDVEDASELRRGRPTLHAEHGIPIAINVGDAMFALALRPLLDNTRLLGLGRALRILQCVSDMVTFSVEGQALELDWIAQSNWDISDDDYVRMVIGKTGWYSFIAPIVIGLICAGADRQELQVLGEFARALSVAFQIQDDVLNVDQDRGEYGKEFAGDLWEGKRTLILLHALRSASADERIRAEVILRRPRPSASESSRSSALLACIEELKVQGELSSFAAHKLATQVAGRGQAASEPKTPADIQFLLGLITRYGSLDYAREQARQWVARARELLNTWAAGVLDSVHLRFLFGITDYVVERTR